MNMVEMTVTALASNLPNVGQWNGDPTWLKGQKISKGRSRWQWLGCKYKTCNPVQVHDDDQALTINTISLPGGPRPRVDFFTTERSPNRDLGISKTRFHINIMSRWAKSLTRMLKNELSVLECVTKLGKQSESLMLATNLTHHPGASLPPVTLPYGILSLIWCWNNQNLDQFSKSSSLLHQVIAAITQHCWPFT